MLPSFMLHLVCGAITMGVVFFSGASSLAAVARSGDYALEYAVSCSGAGLAGTTTGDYSLAAITVSEGVAGGSTSSSDYSVTPNIGAGAVPTSAVSDWMLF